MTTLLDDAHDLLAELAADHAAFSARYPGESPVRQPVHTVYGGAHLFQAGTAGKLGELALRALRQHAPEPLAFARAIGLDEALAEPIYARVVDKLGREPVEDYRIDFEDGYGHRADAEEDADAERSARELARGLDLGLLPPFVGMRIKALAPETAPRAVRTLERFVTTLVDATQGRLPPGFVVTLPKVARPAQVATLVRLFERLEARLGLAHGALRLELMIELPQALIAADGRCALPALVDAAEQRCVAAHLGAYDFTAACNVSASSQRLDHPLCDLARHTMQLALAGTPVALSDGATTQMPVGADPAVVHAAWRLAYRNVRRALAGGIYQGWDLHPAQLPVRYAACYAFFREDLEATAQRLRHFVERAARATRIGAVFDDAATGQGLLNHFLRALASGALAPDELAATGLSADELATRSFAAILAGRTG